MSSCVVASLLAAALVGAPAVGFAQIASPANAGLNAGNNSSPSSATSFSTATFTQLTTVSLVDGVTVAPDGSLEATPELEEQLRDAVESVISVNLSSLQPVLLASAAEPPLAAAVGPSAVLLNEQIFAITVNGESLELPATATLRSYVDQATSAGFSSSSLSLGAQLVAIGVPPQPTLELMASLQDLADRPTIDALARGISAFNAIVADASPALRTQLSASPIFLAASNALRAARNALPPAR